MLENQKDCWGILSEQIHQMRPTKMNPQPDFSDTFVEKLEDDCLRHLESFFRDTYMTAEIFQKYKAKEILKEDGFMDVSDWEGGLAAHVRYHIYSGVTENYKASFKAYSAWTLPRGCFFKVLSIHVRDHFGLIVLLQIPVYAVAYFALHEHPIEKQLTEDAIARFETSLKQEPLPALVDDYWLKRTRFPIGIQWDGDFFFEFDYSEFRKRAPNQKRKNIFRRFFG